MLLHQSEKSLQKLLYQAVQLVDLVPGVKLHIEGHLIVPAAACVEALSRLPDAVNEIALHKGVDILVLWRHQKRSVLHIL